MITKIYIFIFFLLIAAPVMSSEGDDVAIKHYYIGNYYQSENHFLKNSLITIESDTLSHIQANPQTLPPYTMDLSSYWAIPSLQIPMQFVNGYDTNINTDMIDLRYIPLTNLPDSLRSLMRAEVAKLYIHASPSDSLPATILKWSSTENQPILHAFDISPSSNGKYAGFLESLKQFMLFDEREKTYSTQIFKHSSLKREASDLEGGLPTAFFQLPSSKVWVDSLESEIYHSMDYNEVRYRFAEEGDSLLHYENVSSYWLIFSDADNLVRAINDSLLNVDLDQVLVQNYSHWLDDIKKYHTLALIDIMSLNVQRFYEGQELSPLSEGAAASMIIFNGDPFDKLSKMVYIMKEGELHYAQSQP